MLYPTVGLIGRPHHEGSKTTLNALVTLLIERGCTVLLEESIAADISEKGLAVHNVVDIGKHADLAIVVGGDGYMLGAARVLCRYDIDVVGVNRGNLGFLTDINPEDIARQLDIIFSGNIKREHRFLLEVSVIRHESTKSTNTAVNECVLHHAQVAHMMEFELYVDDTFVFSQRSDGLIIATPTGSTAYSLSGGGPILTPSLDAIALVSMFPHTLSSRPVVVDANSRIKAIISNNNVGNLQVSCDSQTVTSLIPGDEIVIQKAENALKLIHPSDYNYFNVLRTKLNWGSKLF